MSLVEPSGTRGRVTNPALQDDGGASHCLASVGASARRPRLRLEMDLGSDSDSSEGEDSRAGGGVARWEGGFVVRSGLPGNQGAGGAHGKLVSWESGMAFDGREMEARLEYCTAHNSGGDVDQTTPRIYDGRQQRHHSFLYGSNPQTIETGECS